MNTFIGATEQTIWYLVNEAKEVGMTSMIP
jgi:hypothetical protein